MNFPYLLSPRLFRILLSVALLLASARAVALTYNEIAPILQTHCVICHNGPAAPKQLRLDSYENVLKGSMSGPVVVTGKSADSELVRRVRGETQPRMPLTGPPYLSDSDVRKISEWIDSGLAPGDSTQSSSVTAKSRKRLPGDLPDYRDVAPVFAQRCVKCHRRNAANGGPPEGLSLLSYDDAIRGGDRAVIIPGIPAASELDRRIRGISHPRMPFDGPPWLNEQEIDLISDWIRHGARDAEGKPAPLPVGQPLRLQGRLVGHWSLDGLPLVVTDRTRIKKNPGPGSQVEVRGYLGNDGRVYATRIRRR